MRRVVQKRAEEADRRRREAKTKSEDDSVAEGEQAALEKKKAEDKERFARETKARAEISLSLPKLSKERGSQFRLFRPTTGMAQRNT